MDDKELVAEEAFAIVEAGGEIPEVAFYNAIYFLTEDPEGPGIRLEEGHLLALKKAVLERYRRIIIRDLTPENRQKSIYRGLARAIVNWRRLKRFCSRQALEDSLLERVREEICDRLEEFLLQEAMDVARGAPCSINCSLPELSSWVKDLGLDGDGVFRSLKTLAFVLMPETADVINQQKEHPGFKRAGFGQKP
ncbi:hypothetical protein [Thermosulfuriphilus sp.]